MLGNHLIRQVAFHNQLTDQYALLNRMSLHEGGRFSGEDLLESMRALNNLPYLESAQCVPVDVAGADAVDVRCVVRSACGLDYGSTLLRRNDGCQSLFLIIRTFGTGRSLLASELFAVSETSTVWARGTDYGPNGLSRSIHASYVKTDPGSVNVSKYTTDSIKGSATFGVPIAQHDH